MTVTIALDPGETIGFAVYDSVFDTITTGQVKDFEVLILLTNQGPDRIVVEYFQPRERRRDKPRLNTKALEVIGVIELYARDRNIKPIYQQPGHAKFFWTNSKLKKLGVYKTGKPHANDAARHLLYCLSRQDRRFIRALVEK